MGVPITQLPRKYCKANCKNMALVVENIDFHGTNGITNRVLTLCCKNEDICDQLFEYLKSTKEV